MVREGNWVKAQGMAGEGVTVNDALFDGYINSTFLNLAQK
jgi:hypothetical protein